MLYRESRNTPIPQQSRHFPQLMAKHRATSQTAQSGQEVAKIRKRSAAGRFSPEFWEKRIERPVYTVAGETRTVLEWHARVQYGGIRKWVPLHSNDRQTAARAASRFYQTLRTKGWDVALAENDPDRNAKPDASAVGEYLAAVGEVTDVRPRTFGVYSYALRRIVFDIAGSKRTASRFDPVHKSWQKCADGLSLSVLTAEAVAKWQGRMITEAGRNAQDRQRAKRNINSYLRNARALFNKKLVRKLSVTLPDPMPFADVELEENPGSTKYHSQIDPGQLLAVAREELAESDADAWKVILLALGAGLRRGEIDNLCWPQIDFGKTCIRVMPLRHFELKTDSSEGTVFVDADMLSELQAARGKSVNLYVIEPETPSRDSTAAQNYRCQETFERVTGWLREHGVTDDKPLHALRKEFGSILAASADIHTASRQLRHSAIKTTADYYTDNRRQTAVPIGELLGNKKAGAK